MPHHINLDLYFRRIGFTGTAHADLATLTRIQQLHPSAIPFENLNPFTGTRVHLGLPAIEEKLLHQGRGGYCFEQNNLLKAALQQIGFQVKGLAARVIFNQPIDAISPLSHMLLLIDLAGEPFIVDSGFGGMSPTAPLRLESDVAQSTAHETYRLIRQGPYFRLEARVKEEWKPLYKFHLEEHFAQDYEVMNWYTSCHPDSHFTNTLIAARAFTGGRYALRNTSFSIHRLGQPSEHRELTKGQELLDILESKFQLNLSGLPTLADRIKILF